MSHLQLMLRQMLTKENIPNVLEWEDMLLKLALRIARELTFTALPHRIRRRCCDHEERLSQEHDTITATS